MDKSNWWQSTRSEAQPADLLQATRFGQSWARAKGLPSKSHGRLWRDPTAVIKLKNKRTIRKKCISTSFLWPHPLGKGAWLKQSTRRCVSFHHCNKTLEWNYLKDTYYLKYICFKDRVTKPKCCRTIWNAEATSRLKWKQPVMEKKKHWKPSMSVTDSKCSMPG